MQTTNAWATMIFAFIQSIVNSLMSVFTGTFDIFKGYATGDKTKMLVIGAVILLIASKIFKFNIKVGK
jgi:uncharacterized membrane protein YdbT with pleckstrin-like domain